jgi:CelD/BcsL family acetyltransferase involved in cellulose biosynthesis
VSAEGTRLLVLPDLDGWEKQWDGLVDRAPLPSPFLRSWWLRGAGGTGRRFLLVVTGDCLRGGLALEEGRRLGMGLLRMMGGGRLCPDHLDLLAAPGHEDVTLDLVRGWLGRPGGRLLDLQGVRAGSRLVEALPGKAHCEPGAIAPWAPLPEEAGAYLAGLPSGFRRTVRRASTRLAAQGAEHRTRRGPSAIRSLPSLRALHEAQWGARSGFLSDFDRFAAGFRLGAEADEAVVHELIAGEAVIATVAAFEVAGRVSLYQSARMVDSRWRDAMSVLLVAVIGDACDRGFTEVDFLRGEEPYKARLAPARRKMFRLLAGHGRAARVASTFEAARSAAQLVAVRGVRAGRAAWGRATS